MQLLPNEKEYLKFLVIPEFNNQFSTNYLLSDFDVSIIPCNNQSAQFVFEFKTIQTTDSLLITAFANLSDADTVSMFLLDNERISGLGAGDEVYTTQIELSRGFLDSGGNYIRASFITPTNENTEDNTLLLQDGSEFLLQDGSNLVLQELV